MSESVVIKKRRPKAAAPAPAPEPSVNDLMEFEDVPTTPVEPVSSLVESPAPAAPAPKPRPAKKPAPEAPVAPLAPTSALSEDGICSCCGERRPRTIRVRLALPNGRFEWRWFDPAHRSRKS